MWHFYDLGNHEGLREPPESLAPSGVEIVYDESGKGTIVSREIPTEEAWNAARGVESLQYILTVVYFGGAFLLSGTLFYRLKLKHPIQKLQAGAQRIMEQDLDFVLEAEGRMNWKAFGAPLKRCEASCREAIRNCGGRERNAGV